MNTVEDEESSVGSETSDISNNSMPSVGRRGWMNFQISLANKATSLLNKEGDMKDWIILDNGSTLDLFCNPELVNNIEQVDDNMELSTNTGVKIVDQKAKAPEFGKVWYDKDAITNIFSLKNLIKKWRVTFDSEKENAFLVHTPKKIIKFTATEDGLYHIKPKYRTEVSNLISSVKENMKGFTHR